MLTRDEILQAPYGAEIDHRVRKVAVSHDGSTVYAVNAANWCGNTDQFCRSVVKIKMPAH